MKNKLESIDSPGAVDKITTDSNAKDFRSWIHARIGMATKSNNLEMKGILQHIEKVYTEYHPKKQEVVPSQYI